MIATDPALAVLAAVPGADAYVLEEGGTCVHGPACGGPLGLRAGERLPGDDGACLALRLAAREALDGTAASVVHPVANGRRLDVDLGPLELGGRPHALLLVRDTTDARRRDDAAERVRDEHLRAVADRVREPLALMQARLRMLADEDAGPVTRLGDRWLRDAARGTAVVEEVADDLRLVTGEVRTGGPQRLHRIDLNALVAEVVATHAEAAADVDVRFTGEAGPASVLADPSRIALAVDHLVGEAVARSAPGERVHVTTSSTGTSERVVRVSDECPAPAGRRSSVVHARAVARAHGGDVRCTPRPRGGTHADLVLPAGRRP